MSGAWHEWLVWLSCMLCMGAAVKLMDDYLDADYDLYRGRRTLASQFGRATLPYALALGVLAAAIDLRVAIAVFFASYVVGMFSTWREKLPTRVPAYVEVTLAVLLSVAFVGWRMALWGVAAMAVVDWLDDVMDLSGDKRSGQTNLVVQIGLAETLMLILVALCTAVLTNARLTAVVLIAVTLVTIGAEETTVHLWKSEDDDGGMSL